MIQLMPLHPKTLSSLASFKSRLVVYFLVPVSQVVREKRPLNGCSSSNASSSSSSSVIIVVSGVRAGVLSFIYRYFSTVGGVAQW